MKKTAFILLFIVSTFIGHSQTGMVKIYNNLSNRDGVISFSFDKNSIANLFDDVLSDDNDDSDFEKLQILYNVNADEKFKKRITGELKKPKYKKIDDNEDNNIKIYTIGNKKEISEFHLIYQNKNKICLISIYGRFDRDKEKELTKVAKGNMIN